MNFSIFSQLTFCDRIIMDIFVVIRIKPLNFCFFSSFLVVVFGERNQSHFIHILCKECCFSTCAKLCTHWETLKAFSSTPHYSEFSGKRSERRCFALRHEMRLRLSALFLRRREPKTATTFKSPDRELELGLILSNSSVRKILVWNTLHTIRKIQF